MIVTNYLRAIQSVASISAIILVLSLPSSSHALNDVASEKEDQVRKQFTEDCLSTSNDKYELYHNCIGKFTQACITHPEFYQEIIDEYKLAFSTIPPNCALAEKNWWLKLYEDYSDDLLIKARDKLSKNRQNELEEYLVTIKNDISPLCDPLFTDWAETKHENAYNVMKCLRDAQAEDVINVYLLNKNPKLLEDRK